MKSVLVLIFLSIFLFNCKNENNNILDIDEEQKVKYFEEEVTILKKETNENNEDLLKYNYGNGNGTILKIESINNLKWIFRKHEQKILNYNTFTVYNFPNGKNIFSIEPGNEINILELAFEENDTNCWVKIKDQKDREGWIIGHGNDPYYDGLGSFIEILNIGEKEWTVIKLLENRIFAKNGSRIYDKPGFNDTKILFQFNYSGNYFENYDEFINKRGVIILAMTKEEDTIDDESINIGGRTDSWIKIRTTDGIEGWVFGGYLEQEGIGGPKIITPEYLVLLMLGEYLSFNISAYPNVA